MNCPTHAAGAVVWFSLPLAALPPTGSDKSHRPKAAIPLPSTAEGGCRSLSEANTTFLHNLRRSRAPFLKSAASAATTTLGPKGRQT